MVPSPGACLIGCRGELAEVDALSGTLRAHECRRPGFGLAAWRCGGRAPGAGGLMAARVRGAAFSPFQRTAARRSWAVVARSFARLSRHGPHDASRLAYDTIPWLQSAQVDPCREHRLRDAEAVTDQAVHHGHQCADRPRALFPQSEISADVLWPRPAATMFQAVEIDGEAYWDGGYAAIPPSRRWWAREQCQRHTILSRSIHASAPSCRAARRRS